MNARDHITDIGNAGFPVIRSHRFFGHQAAGKADTDAPGIEKVPDIRGRDTANGHVVGVIKRSLQILDIVPGHTAGREKLHGAEAEFQTGGYVHRGQDTGQQHNVVAGAVFQDAQGRAGGQKKLGTGPRNGYAAW